VGLAATIGGTLFGQLALEPALDEVSDPEERDRLSTDAWRRFSWVNLAAHALVAGSWFVGRSMLSGREVTSTARTLTRVKDGLVIASLATGLGCNLLGRLLGRKTDQGKGPELRTDEQNESKALERIVSVLGTANLVSNVAVLGVTSALAMEGSKSARFPLWSKRLP
jgi:hypothetical protein